MWFPDRDFVVWVHDLMLERFGGFGGFERGIGLFDLVLEDVKAENGLYRMAAALLKKLVVVRIFADGNHRTAFEVTKTFLVINGGSVKATDLTDVVRFIRGIRGYSVDEVEEWLKYGKVAERPKGDSAEKR